MIGGFRELENITADLGIEAWGFGLEDAFTSAVHGLAGFADRIKVKLNPDNTQTKLRH